MSVYRTAYRKNDCKDAEEFTAVFENIRKDIAYGYVGSSLHIKYLQDF